MSLTFLIGWNGFLTLCERSLSCLIVPVCGSLGFVLETRTGAAAGRLQPLVFLSDTYSIASTEPRFCLYFPAFVCKMLLTDIEQCRTILRRLTAGLSFDFHSSFGCGGLCCDDFVSKPLSLVLTSSVSINESITAFMSTENGLDISINISGSISIKDQSYMHVVFLFTLR